MFGSHAGRIRWPHFGRGRTVLPDHKIHISVHNTKEGYIPRAIFLGGETSATWDKLLEERHTHFAPWLSTIDPHLKARLETAFYDEVMIRPLVSRLKQSGDPELLQDLLFIATTRIFFFPALSRPVLF